MAGFFRSLFGSSGDPNSSVDREFHTNIAGVTKNNTDGANRQDLLRKLRAGEEVFLVREPDNKFDENAIRVENSRGQQLGYIAADIAYRFSGEIERGLNVRVKVSEITGGSRSKKTLGCNLLVQILN